jgi:hypothetical protein
MDSTAIIPAVIQTALRAQNIDPSQCNLMLPTQTYGEVLGMFDKITFESIKVNPDPKAKEVYEPDGPGKGKALAKVPLQRIAIALGIIWDPATTGIVEDTETKSRAKATGAIRKPNGEPVIVSEEKTINAAVLGERDRLSIEERAENGNPDKVTKWGKSDSGKSYPEAWAPWKDDAEKERWIDRAVRKAVIQHQLTKNEKANTGAKERVIRFFIAMKSTYTDKELEKPFVYPCVSIDSAKMLANPDVRAMAVERLSPSIRSIFGPGNHREPIDVTPGRKALVAQSAGSETAESESGQGGPQPAASEQATTADDAEQDDLFEPETQELPVTETPVMRARALLEAFREKMKTSSKATKVLEDTLANKNATLEEINSVIDRFTAHLQKHGKAGAA